MIHYLWTSFIANDSGQNVLVCSSSDGINWKSNLNINQASGFAPSLAFFKGRLYVAFIANDSGQNVLICSTDDGLNWGDGTTVGKNLNIHQASGFAPSLAVFNGRLYVAFIANDSGQNVLICSTQDGKTWGTENSTGGTTPGTNTDIHQASGFAPSLAVFNGRLYVAFIANDSGQNVLICSTQDGKTWGTENSTGGTIPGN
jgi:hypothetical protein